MKRFLLLALAVVLLFSLCACKNNTPTGENDLTDNASNQNVSGTTEVSTTQGPLDSEGVKQLLSMFSEDVLGLTGNIDDYIFKLSSAEFNGEACHKAEAFTFESTEVQGVFYIVGEDCYRYDKAQDKYFKLTDKKAEEIKKVEVVEQTQAPTTTGEPVSLRTEQDVADENNNVLVNRYKNYDLSKVGLPKPITEYEFQATGKTATATDGETVFIIYLLENGAYTEFTFAVGPDKDYYLDKSSGEYKPLS